MINNVANSVFIAKKAAHNALDAFASGSPAFCLVVLIRIRAIIVGQSIKSVAHLVHISIENVILFVFPH